MLVFNVIYMFCMIFMCFTIINYLHVHEYFACSSNCPFLIDISMIFRILSVKRGEINVILMYPLYK